MSKREKIVEYMSFAYVPPQYDFAAYRVVAVFESGHIVRRMLAKVEEEDFTVSDEIEFAEYILESDMGDGEILTQKDYDGWSPFGHMKYVYGYVTKGKTFFVVVDTDTNRVLMYEGLKIKK